ncbi:MAG: HAD-IA family hydrolase [Ignavibacteriaceae bacterium]
MRFSLINGYQHIIWDWNGTLFNDVELCREIINKILEENNLPQLSLTGYRNIFTFPVSDYYKAAGLDFSKTPFEVLGKQFMDEYEQRKFESALYDHAELILEKISAAGISQSVLSAYTQNSLENLINYFGIGDKFIGLAGLDNIYAAGKIETGRRWIKKIGYDPKKILLIGDTVHDFHVAEDLGTDCLLIADGHQGKDKLLECNVTVLDSLKELSDKNGPV